MALNFTPVRQGDGEALLADSSAESSAESSAAVWTRSLAERAVGRADQGDTSDHERWHPPGRRPRRQALGQPYVWDGGGDEREALRSAAFDPADPADSADPADPAGRERPAGRVRPPSADTLARPAWITERAVIGDHLRQVAAWCQIGGCIARHTDADALGEADIRNKAVAAGWCVDLFGRMVCPACQQRYPVWSARPLIERDRAGEFRPVRLRAAGRSRP